jgi:putative phage-type endonuclease
MTVVAIKDEAHWHELRAQHVGGSEVAALFGCCPYLTLFEIWHFKSGTIEDTGCDDTERMFWGQNLEAGIAAGLEKQHGWVIERPAGYYQHPRIKGMGCTPDFFIKAGLEGVAGHGLLQVKNVSFLEYRDNWLDDEPPLHYQLQLQHELACTGLKWGFIGVLIGGNESRVFFFRRHAGAIRRIEQAVAGFWLSVQRGEEPKATSDDYEAARRVYRKVTGTEIDLAADNELPSLCAMALEARERRLAAQKEEDGHKAEIIRKMKGADRARCTGFVIEYPEHIEPVAAKEGYSKQYRKLTIKEETRL